MSHLIPSWAEEHKTAGTQITQINGRYYLYKVSSRWDSKKKRAVKKTEKYLGRITQEGIVPPKHERVKAEYDNIGVKEYGAYFFLHDIGKDIIERLKQVYPEEWKELFVLATLRLIERSPLKNINYYFSNSYLSNILVETRTSKNFLGPFLREVGSRRESIKQFMRSFMVDIEYALIDLTHIFSYSEEVMNAMLGHNKDSAYIPQINLLMVYSTDKLQPVYFRQIPGAIRDVSSLIKTVNEMDIGSFIFIGDKGLHSDDNVEELKQHDINYILALKRNSKYISYEPIEKGDRKAFGGYCMYHKRQIWYSINNLANDESCITYLDQTLKACEENDLALRITTLEAKEEHTDQEKEKLTKYKTKLYEKSSRNGTISVRTNLKKDPDEIYQILKSRINVEQAFDVYKNTLEADRMYMRDDKQVEGWLLINFIALQLYYKIYALLLEKKMLNNHSPQDILMHLKRVYILKVANKWQVTEIPKKSRAIIKKIGINIPIT